MRWYRAQAGLARHPKLRKLARILKVHRAQALGHVNALWSDVCLHAPDGNLRRFEDEDIAESAMWDGDPKVIIDALKECHLISTARGGKNGRHLIVHDWLEWNGPKINEDNRKKRHRDKKKGRDDDGAETPSHRPTNGRTDVRTNERTDEKTVEPPKEIRDLELYAADQKLCKRWDELLPVWKKAFPGIDIAAETAKAHAWEMSNPSRRKVDKIRYLQNWFARAQDRGPAQSGGRGGDDGSVWLHGKKRRDGDDWEHRGERLRLGRHEGKTYLFAYTQGVGWKPIRPI